MNQAKTLVAKLIFPDKFYVKYLGEILTSRVINRREIDELGLYSTKIFGPLGSEERNSTFAYIDLKSDILHPTIYEYLLKINSLYGRIMNSSIYVKYNKQNRTFEISDIENGYTGYSYFLEHLPELDLGSSDSDDKQNMIDVINKYREKGKLTNNKLLVLPAGLRDIEIKLDGQTVEHEINDYYKKVFNNVQLLNFNNSVMSTKDRLLLTLQNRVNDLMAELFKVINGKKKLIGGQYVSRHVDYITRNVATGRSVKVDDVTKIDFNPINITLIGLYQYSKAITPITKYYLNDIFLNKVLDRSKKTIRCFDPDNNTFKNVEIDDKTFRMLSTKDGLDKLLSRMKDDEFKNKELVFDGCIAFPVVETNGETRIYVNTLPDGKVRALTYGELVYNAIYKYSLTNHGYITRYPITEQGSIFITKVRVNTTSREKETKVEIISEYGQDNFTTTEYPIPGLPYDSSLSPSYARAKGLGLDYDGDKIVFTAFITEDANEEADKFLKSVNNYVKPDGKLTLDLIDHPLEILLKSMTK